MRIKKLNRNNKKIRQKSMNSLKQLNLMITLQLKDFPLKVEWKKFLELKKKRKWLNQLKMMIG